MGMPSINIIFSEAAKTVVRRSNAGTVGLLLATAALDRPEKIYRVGDKIDVGEHKKQVELALLGGETAPEKVICYSAGANYENLKDALEYFENVRVDYIAFTGNEIDTDKDAVVDWVKNCREKEGIKVKAVLANKDADCEGIINLTTTVTVDAIEYEPEQFCGRIAGMLAGTPITRSVTYMDLPEAEDCTRLKREEMDAAIDAGEFILFWDGEKVKVGRGINSYISGEKSDQFKKIKLIDTMDQIHKDIRRLVQDNWIGKHPNTYNEKCLLISAINNYFSELVNQNVLSSANCGIDINGNLSYLKENGIDTSAMTEDEIRKAETGSKVFLHAAIKMIDAMEDIEMQIEI